MFDKFRHRVVEALFDRKTGEPNPLFWCFVGLILAVAGLAIFAVDVAAMLRGEHTARVSRRPYGSSTIPLHVRALVGLFLGTCGVATAWLGLTLHSPSIAARPWARWIGRLVLGPLVFLLLAMSALVAAKWIGLV
jgi:heme O synthase-like polyprenyltransferase